MNVLALRRLHRIHILIKRKSTGAPTDLAMRLGVSPRTVYRTIDRLRQLGASVIYDRNRCSYMYMNDTSLIKLLDLMD